MGQELINVCGFQLDSTLVNEFLETATLLLLKLILREAVFALQHTRYGVRDGLALPAA